VLVFLVVLGGLIYLAIRLLQRPGEGSGRTRIGRRPVAPDDDPTFLRDLDTQVWEERRRQREAPREGTDDSQQ
jgi:hypothetical protein